MKIVHRFTGATLYEGEHESLRDAVIAAVAQKKDLAGANLAGAYLADANLTGAYLTGANLARANLTDAYLADATMPAGYRWEAYLADVVPALLKAGGKALASVATKETWECHSWENCPMAVAFDVHDADQVPALHRWEAKQFVQLFDAKLIPLPKVEDVT